MKVKIHKKFVEYTKKSVNENLLMLEKKKNQIDDCFLP